MMLEISSWRQVVRTSLGMFWIVLGAAAAFSADTPAFPVTFQDAASRTVTLDHAPQRIVVVGRGPHMILHLLYMFPKAAHRIAGMENRSMDVDAFLHVIDPNVSEKQQLQINPGPEQIMSLKPDLVLMKGESVSSTGDALAKFGVPVVYFSLETPDRFFQDLENAGRIMGNSGRAEEIGRFYRIRLERLARGTETLSPAEIPDVLVVHYSNRGKKAAVKIPAPSWMQTLETIHAGGNPVWLKDTQTTDGWSIVNFEQVATWDPDVIVAVIWFSLDRDAVMASLREDAHWSKLNAVKNGKLLAFPGDIFGWDSPEPRWILGMMWMARQLHPQRFEDIDIRREIDAFFMELYRLDSQTVEREILPKMKLSQ